MSTELSIIIKGLLNILRCLATLFFNGLNDFRAWSTKREFIERSVTNKYFTIGKIKAKQKHIARIIFGEFDCRCSWNDQKEESYFGISCTSHIDRPWSLIMPINVAKQPIETPIKHQFFHYEALRLAGLASFLIDTLVLNRACLTSPLTTWLA